MSQPANTLIRLMPAHTYTTPCTCMRTATHTLYIGSVQRGYTHSLCGVCLAELLSALVSGKETTNDRR